MTVRIGVTFTVLMGLLMIALSIPMVIMFRDYQYEKLQLSLERDALVVVTDLSELEPDQWQDRVTTYQDRTGVRVTVVDAQARVVTDSEGAEPGTSFSRPELDRALAGEIVNGVRFSRTLDTQLRNVAVPIRDESQIRGAVRLSVPESLIDDQVRRLMWAFVTILVAVLAAALVAGWALARALSRPLGRLSEGAARVGDDPSARVGDVGGPREVQEVAQALDTTAAKLEAMLDTSREVAAEASHHIRTPMAAMRLRLENLSETGDPESARQAQAAIEEIDRLSRRVDQVMALATAEAALDLDDIDVGRTAYQRTRDWQALAHDRGIELKCEYESGLIRAPIGTVDRVLDELVGNALNYAHSTVAISVEVVGESVVLLVADDGSGISEHERERVFDRFVRGENAIPGGSGLGLALVRQSALAGGGNAELIDAANGTSVKVQWPHLDPKRRDPE